VVVGAAGSGSIVDSTRRASRLRGRESKNQGGSWGREEAGSPPLALSSV
jgi:hypothetical protein